MKNIFLLFLCLVNYFTDGQPPVPVKNLVFEAAGIRGIAYCGVIQEMESRNMMKDVERVCGTSSGAIVALTVSLGYTGKEIENIISQTNFKKFNDGKYIFFGGINRMKKYYGWYRGKKLVSWLEKIIVQKTGNANITFAELHQKGFKDLYITGTSLNKQQPVIFSYQTFPGMKIKDAVRVSAGIPLYFEAAFMDSTGALYFHPKQKQGLDIMVDGGFLENYPIHIFDKSMPDPYTIGFRIDPEGQIENDKGNKTLTEMPIENLNQYFMAFYNIVIENLNRQQLTKADWDRTVSISDGNIQPKLRKLSKEEVNTLIENGKRAVKPLLNQQ